MQLSSSPLQSSLSLHQPSQLQVPPTPRLARQVSSCALQNPGTSQQNSPLSQRPPRNGNPSQPSHEALSLGQPLVSPPPTHCLNPLMPHLFLHSGLSSGQQSGFGKGQPPKLVP